MVSMPGIRTRVMGMALVPVTVISVILLFQLINGKIVDLDQSLRARAASMVRQLAPAAEYGLASGNLEVLQDLLDKAAAERDVHGVAVFSDSGIWIAQSGSVRWRDVGRSGLPRNRLRETEFADRLVYYAPIRRTEVQVDDFLPVSGAVARSAPRTQLLGWVGLEVSRDATLRSQRKAIQHSLYILLAGLAVCFFLAWRIGRQITRPIFALAHTLSRIGEGRLDERVAVSDTGELGILQRGINQMAAHLQSMHEEMQQKIDQATARLIYQASHDSLTGLINRREFEQRLQHAVESAVMQNREHVLCYMDLDQFKIINDTSGHGAGDELLRQLAMMFRDGLRERDTLARLGGDEFALLLENCGLDAAIEIVDAFRADIERFRFKWEDRVFSVGVSVGVVSINAASGNAVSLLSAADAACYMAKDRGRNRLHVYETGDSELAHHRGEMQWITRIHKAMEDGRLALAWQEIFPVQGLALGPTRRAARHVELLLRMRDESGNEILPMAFIPAAERYLIMPTLDAWVVTQTLDVCRRYIARQTGIHCLFALNLSGASLKDPEFRRVLLDSLHAEPQLGPYLCFEITETAAIGNLMVVNQFIHAMREFGCQFALDDFGSGLSSFSYLKNLRLDFLKIDGAFVRDMAENTLDRSMVDAIHRIGHQMGLTTVAEYVETDRVLAILRQIGVNHAQGNLLHRPAPMEAFWE